MYGYYEIIVNDTLSSIADQYQTTVEVLAQINKLDPMYVPKVGDKILVPISSPTLFDYHRVKHGEVLYQIAEKYQVDVSDLAKLNGLDLEDFIYEGDLLIVPKPNTQIYITKTGDSLKKIAGNLGISERDIIEQNTLIYLVEDQLLVYKK